MKILVEGKQVGEVSYFVKNIDVLSNIIEEGKIRSSLLSEINPKTNKKMKFVSLSRNMYSAPKRNISRWEYGVILDGDKLSDRYSIEPYSFAGNMYKKGTNLKVKAITSYDDNTYTLSLVNWPTFQINKKLYDSLKDYIDNKMTDSTKELKKLQYSSEGKRRVNGHKISEKYLFNVPTGGFTINSNSLPTDVASNLFNNSSVNEQEERIWTDKDFINIDKTVVGIILPKDIATDFKESDDERVIHLRELLNKKVTNYKILTY